MKDITTVWQELLSIMEVEVHSLGFDVWIRPLRAVRVEDDVLVLCAPSAGAKSEVVARYLPLLKHALRNIDEAPAEIVIVSEDEMPQPVIESMNAERKIEAINADVTQHKLNPRYNFAEFAVGECNALATAAAHAVAETPGEKFNPLFIYGDVGLGKTHLMQAIGNDLRASRPHFKMLYVSMITFLNEFITSIHGAGGSGNNRAFRDKYRNVDLLMIDDVQYLSRKQSTQDEIFHMFEELKAAGKQMVFTSDRRPQDIPDLDERVRSRFASSMIVDIQPPDLETRIAILQKKAQHEKKNIGLDELTYIAERVTSNVREMEGVLTKIMFLSTLYGRKVDLAICEEALKDYLVQECDDISVDEIIDCTCKYYGVQKSDVVGKRKNKDVVLPRQVAIYLITELTDVPLSSIGSYFGGREHTTMMYARDKVSGMINSEPKVKTAVNDIKAMVLRK